MKILLILLGIILFFILITLIISYICFHIAFYAPKKKGPTEEYPIPEGDIYEPFRDLMVGWIKEVRALPHEEFAITSFDGLALRGKYYEYAPGAPIELMLHGYRGEAERDLCGGVQRCFALGRSALIVDQRSCGHSEGNVITFGINERKDCLAWIDFMVDHFGPDVQIILTGISMGASTVIMTAAHPLPPNVVGVLADCGFTSANDIIKKTIKEMKLPVALSYPFVKLGAKIYGKFDLEETSPIEAVKKCTLPIIFFHGEDDAYVPCHMSKQNFEFCTSPKKLVTIPGAGHGLSYPVAPEAYLEALREFFGPVLA